MGITVSTKNNLLFVSRFQSRKKLIPSLKNRAPPCLLLFGEGSAVFIGGFRNVAGTAKGLQIV